MGFFIGNISSDWLPDYITNETLSRHTIYGVAFDGSTHKGVRLYDAEGKNWTPSSTTVPGVDDFKNLDPFKFRRVLLKPNTTGGNASIDSYYDELNINITQYNQKAIDEGLDRFIEYKPYFYSRPNKWTWLISPDYIDGFYPCPAISRGGKVLSNWYMGEFMPNDSYRMLNGQYPIVNVTNAGFRSALRAKGYRLSDYANYQSVLMLALVKYADLNFQYCLGPGWNSGNSRQISTGDSILGDDGYINLSNGSIKTMGLVDLYGNVWKHNDGIFEYGGYVYINDDLDNITEWPTMSTWQAMGYKKTNIHLAGGTGIISRQWVTDISYDSQFPFMTYPTSVSDTYDNPNGKDINPIGDSTWINNDNTMRCVVLGGNVWYGSSVGPFCWDSSLELLYTDVNHGALASAFPVARASSL